MSLVNLDLYLVDLFHDFLKEVNNDNNSKVIDEIFQDRPEAYREAIKSYLHTMNVTKDLQDRSRDGRNIYILPSHPLRELAFPQIAVYLADEHSTDWYLGGTTGTDPVYIEEPDFIGWEYEEGYIAQAQYRVDVVANTKEETIWLARLCQRAVLGNIKIMETLGFVELNIGMADLQLHPEHFPSQVFGRGVFLNGKAQQTWTHRVVAQFYQTGDNLALHNTYTPVPGLT